MMIELPWIAIYFDLSIEKSEKCGFKEKTSIIKHRANSGVTFSRLKTII